MTNLKITTSSGTFEIPDSGYLRGPGTVCPKTPLHIREMTSKETIQTVKEDIALLQEKLKKLEEMEKHKSPVEEAYKRVYGNYPDTGICNGMSYVWWDVFCKGYNASKEECKVEEPTPTPPITNVFVEGNPPDGCSSWSEFFEEFIRTGNLRGLKISSLNNEVKEPKPKTETLHEIILKWCDDDIDLPCGEVVNMIEQWLPDRIEYEDEDYDKGWNDALRTIKEKLR